MRTSLLYVAVSLLLALVAIAAAADSGSNPASKKDRAKTPAGVTAQQEAEVLAFLRQHHNELADLLGHLQLSRPAEYARAVRDLWHASERLRQLEKGDRDRYELELQAWVIQSNIQLLAARLAMSDSPALRAELRQLLDNQFELRVQLAQADHDRAVERLNRLEDQLRRLADNRAEILEREFQAVTKSSERLKVKRKDLFDAKAARKTPP
jgi:exonuclease VII large subunit